jgi:mannose-6-phosphate isomerase-like protein (cupin superfamily)
MLRAGCARQAFRQTGAMSLVVPPYPEPRYLEDKPEVSAWLKRAPENGGAPPDYETAGVNYHYLANQQATAGDYGLYRVEIAAKGGGPGPHFHRTMSEAFFVLSGTVKLYDGSDWIDGHPNDFLFVPPGGVHGFRNEADEPTSILMLFAPGAPREHYFEGFEKLADLTDEERREWFVKNDNFIVD